MCWFLDFMSSSFLVFIGTAPLILILSQERVLRKQMFSALVCLKLPWFFAYTWTPVQWGVEFNRILGRTAFSLSIWKTLLSGIWSCLYKVHWQSDYHFFIETCFFFLDALRTFSFFLSFWNLTITYLSMDLFLYILLGRLGGPFPSKNPHPCG